MQTNLKVRVIPIIQYFDWQIVKSREFKDYRTVGNLDMTVDVYNKRMVDELVIIDIGSSKQDCTVNKFVLETLSRHCLMPVTFGGGITNLKDIETCLMHGCDKVIINTEIISNHKFAREAVERFGSQCIVISVDYLCDDQGNYLIFSHCKKNTTHLDFFDYLKMINDSEVGELLLTNAKKEGCMGGMDLEIIPKIQEFIGIPVLLNGGVYNPQHIYEGFKSGASAVCASSIFSFTQYGYRDIKIFLQETEIPVRNNKDSFF